jgi:hypothetical protein
LCGISSARPSNSVSPDGATEPNFHERLDGSEWLLLANESVWAGRGRTHGRCNVWTRDARLVATYTQDNIVRAFADRRDHLVREPRPCSISARSVVSLRRFSFVVLAACVGGAVLIMGSLAGAVVPTYSQGFEVDTSGWVNSSGTISRQPTEPPNTPPGPTGRLAIHIY